MKTIKFYLLAIVVAFSVSCSSDDTSSVDSSGMLGEWKLSEFNYDGSTKMSYDNMNYDFQFTGELTESDLTINFKEDGTYFAKGAYSIALSMEGMVQDIPLELNSSTGNWSIDGDMLNFSNGFITMSTGEGMASKPGTAKITEVTSNKMVLYFEDIEEINQNGFENSINYSGTYILTR